MIKTMEIILTNYDSEEKKYFDTSKQYSIESNKATVLMLMNKEYVNMSHKDFSNEFKGSKIKQIKIESSNFSQLDLNRTISFWFGTKNKSTTIPMSGKKLMDGLYLIDFDSPYKICDIFKGITYSVQPSTNVVIEIILTT